MYVPVPISVQPGIYTEDTNTLASQRYIDGNMVRFWKGQPERWGGWQYVREGEDLINPPRGGITWIALNGEPLVAFGTANGLYVLYQGSIWDITPAGFIAGTVAGLAVGGWGSGGWGSGGWGYSGSYDIYTANGGRAMTWQFATWGENLIACARGQGIYELDTSAFQAAPGSIDAEVIFGSPTVNLGVFAHQGSRHLIALGAEDILTNTDPLLVRWADQETTTTWTPTATNTAGSLRCDAGNEIVGSVEVSGGRLILTDVSSHFLRYIGGQFVFSLTGISYSSGMIGPHAAAELNGTAYWMGRDRFYSFNGREVAIPCDVHNYVFDNINLDQGHMVYAGTNKRFGEVLWFYPSAGSNEVDRCVSVNEQGHWSIHKLARTTWLDRAEATDYPIAVNPSGVMFYHEIGTTDEAGVEIDYYLETGELSPDQPEPSAGVTNLSLRKFVPDFKRSTGIHSLSIKVKDYPHRDVVQKGPYWYDINTAAFPVRARGARFQLRFSGSGDFRMGQMKAYATRNGARQQ